MHPKTRRTAARLRLLLTNPNQYVRQMGEQDIDHLLASLAKAQGLTADEAADLVNNENDSQNHNQTL